MQYIIKVLALLAIPLGGAFVYGGVQSIGDSITPFPVPKDAGELVVDGAYAYVRHPMYSGTTTFWLA